MAINPRRGGGKLSPRRTTRQRSCIWSFLFGAILGGFGVGLYWMTQSTGQLPPVAVIPKPDRPAPQKPSFEFEKILKETVVESKDNTPLPPPAPRPEPPPKSEPVTPPAADAILTFPAETPAKPIAEVKAKPVTDVKAKAKADAEAKSKQEAKAKVEAKAKAETKAKTEAKAATGTYVLQMGSFKTAKEADAMKAKLAMRGVTTKVKAVTLKDGQVWYRVTTGPLAGKTSMESTRATITKQGSEAIPVKVK
jgi:cell division septation protein DedD